MVALVLSHNRFRRSLIGDDGIQVAAAVLARVEEARLKVHIAEAYPLAEAAKAHQRIEAGHVLGKIVLRVPLSGVPRIP